MDLTELPPLYKQVNDEQKQIIIHLGCGIYKRICDNKTDEEIIKLLSSNEHVQELYGDIHMLKKDNKSLKNEKHVELQEERKRLQKIHDTEMNERIEKERCSNQREIELLKKEIVLIENSCESEIESVKNICEKQEEQIKEYKILFGKQNHSNTKEKGDYAEKWMKTIVDKGLSFDEEAEYFDTSDKKGSGDGILHLKKYKLRIMVEMKNKTALDEHDIQQFNEHSCNDFLSDKVDLSLLISFNNSHIRGQRCCSAYKHDKNDKRMIYYGLSENYTMEEKTSKLIDTIHEICEKHIQLGNETTNEKQIDMIQLLESTIKNYMKDINYHKQHEKETLKILENIRKKLEETTKDSNSLWKYLWESGNIKLIDKRLLNNSEGIIKPMLINRIKTEMKEKMVSLVPANKSGNRSNWRNRLIEDLKLVLEEYEKKIYQKLKWIELID